MPHGSITETLPAPSDAVFHLLHDYSRRLQWDTLLSDARLTDNFTHAQLHATSLCTGRWYLGSLALKTRYIAFTPPSLAAVKLLNRPLFFHTFAASIRHKSLPNNTSSLTYTYHFLARPTCLRWLLHPIMSTLFRWETKKRLRALRRHFSQHPTPTDQPLPG